MRYVGEETKKAHQNFNFSNTLVDKRIFYAIADIKIAAALAHAKLKNLGSTAADAIIAACEEIKQGRFDDAFMLDAIQGGAGTSIHMNINEVIAARASEIAGTKVHTIDDVNKSQSTNDVVPTAMRLMILRFIDEYEQALQQLHQSFDTKAHEFTDIIKVGRTHLQDAVPITLGQEFGAYASFVQRDMERIKQAKTGLLVTNLGGTAIGTGISSSKKFITRVNKELAKTTGYGFRPAKDLIDATQNVDVFLHIAYLLKISSVGISKICNDIRVMASGPRAGLGEINLPVLQKGSSIMAAKVNPIIPEAFNQISFQIAGNAAAAALAVVNGQFELNVMMPAFIKNIVESFTLLINGTKTLSKKCIDGITANKERCFELYENSLCMATALNEFIGYDQTEKLVKKALETDKSLIAVAHESSLLTQEQLDVLRHPIDLTRPS